MWSEVRRESARLAVECCANRCESCAPNPGSGKLIRHRISTLTFYRHTAAVWLKILRQGSANLAWLAFPRNLSGTDSRKRFDWARFALLTDSTLAVSHAVGRCGTLCCCLLRVSMKRGSVNPFTLASMPRLLLSRRIAEGGVWTPIRNAGVDGNHNSLKGASQLCCN
jgi:hypothetical protein